MADRIYKGELLPEQDPAFPEASCDFHKPHAGGLVPFEVLKEILEHNDISFCEEADGRIWLHGDGGLWATIGPAGSVEIGASGV